MDLDRTVRPWLVACGKHFGANEAFRYRDPDESAGIERPYFKYRLERFAPANIGRDRSSSLVTEAGNDVDVQSRQMWLATIEVRLLHFKFGCEGLAWCSVAAEGGDQDIVDLLADRNANYKRAVKVEDETEYDSDDFYYDFKMTCEFHTWVYFKHKKTNFRVTDVDIDDAFTIQ